MSSSVQPGGGVGNTHSCTHKFSFSSFLSYTETQRQLPGSILCRMFHLSPADFPVTHGKDLGLPPSAPCRHNVFLASLLSSCKKQTKKNVVRYMVLSFFLMLKIHKCWTCEDLLPADLYTCACKVKFAANGLTLHFNVLMHVV